MGLLDRFFGRAVASKAADEPKEKNSEYAVAASPDDMDVTTAYIDRPITFNGCLRGFDYDKL